MNYVLIITNELNGQTEIVNRLFSSVQEAQQYANENHLILHKIISETEYQNLMVQYQQQRIQQRNQRPYQNPQPQNQSYPHERILIQEQESEEPEPIPQQRPPKPVFNIFKPHSISPMFVLRRKR
jgi:hypothetical protein